MNQFHFSLSAIPNTTITLFNQTKNKLVVPAENGFIGSFPDKTKLILNLKVQGEHSCYVIEPKDFSKTAKNKTENGYFKNFTINCAQGFGQISPWPANMICLEVPGHSYNLGLISQYGRFFFVIEEHLATPTDNFTEGTVIWFSLLRGFGAVAYKPGFDARIHWSKLHLSPFGLRFVQTSDLLNWQKEDIKPLGGESSFRYEIDRLSI